MYVVESDHSMIAVKMSWCRKKLQRTRVERKKVVAKEDLERFGVEVENRIEGSDRTNEDMEAVMKEVARELEKEEPRRQRLDWWDREVEEAVERRRTWNREHRRREKQFGREETTTKDAWDRYLSAKQEASDLVAVKLAEWNQK